MNFTPVVYSRFKKDAGASGMDANEYATRTVQASSYGQAYGTTLAWQDVMLNVRALEAQFQTAMTGVLVGVTAGIATGGVLGAVGVGSVLAGAAALGTGTGVSSFTAEYGSGASARQAFDSALLEGSFAAAMGPATGLVGRAAWMSMKGLAAYPRVSIGLGLAVGSGLLTPDVAEGSPLMVRAASLFRAGSLRHQIALMRDAGVPGSNALLNRMMYKSRNVSVGAYFHARGAHAEYAAGRLAAVEFRLAQGYGDILRKSGLAIERKSWRGWDRLSLAVKNTRLRGMEEQIGQYLKTPGVNRLRMEFNRYLPDDVLAKLKTLKVEHDTRLSWRVVP